jgi:hypothetical protein
LAIADVCVFSADLGKPEIGRGEQGNSAKIMAPVGDLRTRGGMTLQKDFSDASIEIARRSGAGTNRP